MRGVYRREVGQCEVYRREVCLCEVYRREVGLCEVYRREVGLCEVYRREVGLGELVLTNPPSPLSSWRCPLPCLACLAQATPQWRQLAHSNRRRRWLACCLLSWLLLTCLQLVDLSPRKLVTRATL